MARKPEIHEHVGLTLQDAAKILGEEGHNELPSSKQRGNFQIALDVMREPMFLLLVACGAIYLLVGDMQEAMMLLAFVFFVMGITLYQERKTERALEALRDLSSPRALVIRDGAQQRIAGRDVVRGDIIVLAEGDRVPADALVLDCTSLSTDESLLTGESIAVRKVPGDATSPVVQPGGDDLPFVFSGTLVVRGQGIARVIATGQQSAIGKIGKALQAVTSEETLLQRETGRLVKILATAVFVLCALLILVYGITRGAWLDGVLAGLTLAMAVMPNELPVVLTIFLALGAWRLSRTQVLARSAPVVETLGSATVLCVDKTGTLTLNRMSVSALNTDGTLYKIGDFRNDPPPDTFHDLVEFSILASQRDPYDPMERAIKDFGEEYLAHTEHLHGDWRLEKEYPLSPELLAMSHVWRAPEGNEYVIAAKGAPEAVADLCHFSDSQHREMMTAVTRMADDGLRVLGVARSYFREVGLPGEQHDFTFEFLGLVGLADPVRPTVAAALQDCYRAGIRMVMITGDYPGTARSIARQIGLVQPDEVITGPELENMSEVDLQERIRTVNIFARVVPEQKLRLVKALKSNGEVVAMTGDGVNDAPALKSAHIGIAMGGRGTDVAREASDLVLLDDDFASIVRAVKMGRRIFDNLKKAMAYLLAIHIPIAGMSLIPVLFKWPLLFMPIHIAFLHLIIDPACSIVYEVEPAEMDAMNRPPRDPKEPLFSKRVLLLSTLQGVSVLVVLLIVFGVSLVRGHGELEARTLAFTTLIIANLGLMMTNRSWSNTIGRILGAPNSALWWVTGGAVIFLGMALNIPIFREVFRFSVIHPLDVVICVSAGISSIVWFELFKMFSRKKEKNSP
ncbi:cation-translocating P-type ATPase [Geobacter pelophilus]|uniref:Cation-translocating P-type ATPase n=1 Tax=Geoanaerobacter pelophilus TaxID=60036 RepID=A0AAW4KYD2_9BACT|nr:cation-translocating P-type ATPase [Geoanaerobacter pelophilus]MBT0663568.1 cation-translocating P-type ATPase [Geoanaerobacter pelophilus]MDD2539949.1 cation-translocating P-type ATPase [Desulfuromonadaceae bacterium]